MSDTKRITLTEAIDILTEHEKLCDVCRYDDLCNYGVTGGPSGPIFPPCYDNDISDLLYEDDAIELATEIRTEEVAT